MKVIYLYISYAVLSIISRSNLLTLRSTMEMAQLLLHLRDSMHHYLGTSITKNLACCYSFLRLLLFIPSICYCIAAISYLSLSFVAHSSILMKIYACRPCVLYSDKTVQKSAEVTDDLSKCSIKEVEKPVVDRTSGIPMTRLPLQVPQSTQGKYCFI